MKRPLVLSIAGIPDPDSLITWSWNKELGVVWEGGWANTAAMALKGL